MSEGGKIFVEIKWINKIIFIFSLLFVWFLNS